MTDRVARPVKRQRRLSADHEDAEDIGDWVPQSYTHAPPSTPAAGVARPRRGPYEPPSTATINRAPTAPVGPRQSIRLTVKAPPSKLREATTSNSISLDSRDTDENSNRPRTSRNKKPVVDETSTEDEDDDAEMRDEGEEDDEDQDEDEDEGEEDEEDEDDAGDADLDDGQPPPLRTIKPSSGPRGTKPTLTETPPFGGRVKSVEAKEVEMAGDEDDDEELSELESPDEEELAEGAEGEGVDVEGDGLESDDETPVSGSRAQTPDISKLTRRQRGQFEDLDGGLLALSNEAQKKKHLTAEEHAIRRAEMARRRKNLSDKRNEEEKMDTINRLLKKQAPKRRGRRDLALTDAGGESTPAAGEDYEPVYEKPKATMVRWISNQYGSRVGVPEEWLGTPVGRVFEKGDLGEERGAVVRHGITLIEEVA